MAGYLTLSRMVGESIIYRHADGSEIELLVAEIRGDKVRLASRAPDCISINRHEIQALVDAEAAVQK